MNHGGTRAAGDMDESLLPVDGTRTKRKTPVIPNLKLKYERELRGWSQAKVAEEIGAQTSVINRWENGHVFPSPYYREKLCTLFEKDAQELGLIKSDGTDVLGEKHASSQLLQKEAKEEGDAVPALLSVQQTQRKRLFSRRTTLLGLVGIVATAAAGGLWWIKATTASHSSTNVSPGMVTAYIYKASPPVFFNFISWSPLGSFIACAAGDNTAKVIKAANGDVEFVYRGHTNYVNCVSWAPDETRLASASADKTVQVWEALTGKHVLTYTGHTASVYCVSWSHDGTRIASSGEDTKVQVWDAFTGKLLTIYRGHTVPIWNMRAFPNREKVLQ